MSDTRTRRRHHCAECHRFVREDTVEVYWSIDENCQTGSAECGSCGCRTEVYLAARQQGGGEDR